jgi:hypothetical protein
MRRKGPFCGGNRTILGLAVMPPSIAIITTVYNEDVLLPIWLRYYGAHLGREHLYVIDDGSNDGSTTGLEGVNVIRLERAPIDQDSRAFTVSLFHRELLKHYDVVIFTDVDEFLVVDPLVKLGLADYIAKHAGAHTNAIGFDVIHNQFDEAIYSPNLGVFRQRRYLKFSRAYCKQLIHREPVLWMPGFHYTNMPRSPGVGLYLFHLRAVDYELSRRRINNRNKLEWSERSLRKGQGAQNRLDEAEYLRLHHLDRPELFQAAMAEGQFQAVAMQAAQLIGRQVDNTDPRFDGLEAPLLTLPDRFRDALPAVNDSAIADAQRGPALVPEAEAQRLYIESRATVIHKKLRFGEE